jgi:hypothetical protein
MAAAEVPEIPEGEAWEVVVEWPLALDLADSWRQRQLTLNTRVNTVKTAWQERRAQLPPPANLKETSPRLDECRGRCSTWSWRT